MEGCSGRAVRNQDTLSSDLSLAVSLLRCSKAPSAPRVGRSGGRGGAEAGMLPGTGAMAGKFPEGGHVSYHTDPDLPSHVLLDLPVPPASETKKRFSSPWSKARLLASSLLYPHCPAELTKQTSIPVGKPCLRMGMGCSLVTQIRQANRVTHVCEIDTLAKDTMIQSCPQLRFYVHFQFVNT